jgi:ribA/ribD-fused uncharacterized protein
MITQFKDSYGFLSNFFYCDVNYMGIDYPSTEHAFQAAKTWDVEKRIWIASAPTPGIAKRRGRQIELREGWESERIRVMYDICRIKFSQPFLTQALLDTEDVPLVEGNFWHDQFWGNCFCDTHQNIEGRNYLGKILMHIRSVNR